MRHATPQRLHSTTSNSSDASGSDTKMIWEFADVIESTSPVTMAAAGALSSEKYRFCAANRSPHTTCNRPDPAPPVSTPSASSNGELSHADAGMNTMEATMNPTMTVVRCSWRRCPSSRERARDARHAAMPAAAAPMSKNAQSTLNDAPSIEADRQNTIHARHRPNPAITNR